MNRSILLLLGEILLVIAMVSIPFGGCNKEDNNEPEMEVIIPETTKIISEADWENYLHEIDSADFTLQLDSTVDQFYSLEPGDIIVSSSGEGLLRKIKKVTEDNGQLVVETEFASISEAIEQGEFNFSDELDVNLRDLKVQYFYKGVEIISPSDRSPEESQLEVSLEVPIDDNASLSGTLTLDPAISGTFRWDDFSLRYCNLEFTFDQELSLDLDVTIDWLELEEEIDIMQITFPTITIVAGGFPIVITPVFTISVGVSLEVSSELSTGISQEAKISASVTYEHGEWSQDHSLSKGFGKTPPELSNTAQAKAYVKPKVEFKIYQVISPNISSELYGLIEAELGASPWWSLYGGLKTNAGVKVGVLDITVLEFEITFFDIQFLIATADEVFNQPPNAVFSIEPPAGTVATNFLFDATETNDYEDPPEEVEIRWDWEGDGIWDTPFGIEKTAYHMYPEVEDYAPKMEARDSEGLTQTEAHDLSVVEVLYETGTMMDPRDGQIYRTVKIMDQWWMAESLNYGTMIEGSVPTTDNDIQEKYCYDNNPSLCGFYGAIYDWMELMDYDTTQGKQGLCPPGWHVPTDYEWKIMETNLGMSWQQANGTGGGRGADVQPQGVGTQLKVGGLAGFEAMLSGIMYSPSGNFNIGSSNPSGWYWTSTNIGSASWDGYKVMYRAFYRTDEGNFRYFDNSATKNMSVRCVKD